MPHGFMTRRGGVSTGALGGLQCGFGAGDDEAAVAENRRLAAEAVLPGAALMTPYQIHSADVVSVRAPFAPDARPRADALVTDRPGLLLGIVTADCVPVLLADESARVIGAAHAGWRGALYGVLEATLDAMEALGAARGSIAAAIGPAIAQESYEVDDALRERFGAGAAHHFSRGKAGHWQFDLPAYVAERLAAAGAGEVDDIGRDTYADPAHFYSFRRATHRAEADYGRQLSLIGLR